MASDSADRRSPGTAQGPVVSICIVSYEARDYLARCLESIRAHTRLPHEVVIVDNASGPATRELLASLDYANVILNEENRLWCPAMNQALRAANPRSRFLLLLNPDIEVLRDDWLERMVMAMAGPRIGLVGTEHNFRALTPTFGALDGSCLLVRRELLEDPAIGYLDESLPWNGSPFVLTARAWKRGWGYRLMPPRPRLVVHHGGRSRAEASKPVRNRPINHRALLEREGFNPRRPARPIRVLRRWLINLGRPQIPTGP